MLLVKRSSNNWGTQPRGRRCPKLTKIRGINRTLYFLCCSFNDFCFLLFRVEWKVNEVADSEATTFAIFYNNTLFLFLFLLLSYLCRGFHPAVYPYLSV